MLAEFLERAEDGAKDGVDAGDDATADATVLPLAKSVDVTADATALPLAKARAKARAEGVRVPLPWELRHQQSLAVVIPDVLSEIECAAIIRHCERRGFEQALLNVGTKEVLDTGLRKSGRITIDDVQAANQIFARVRHLCPAEHTIIHGGATWSCVGLNERLRVLKYEPGGYFAPHQDGSFVRMQGTRPLVSGEPGDRSFMTLMLYLNTPAKGGDTNFMSRRDQSQVSPVAPQTGAALLFDHNIMHEGAMLESGVKYAIRTDVMYRRG